MEPGIAQTEHLKHLTKGDFVHIPAKQVPNQDTKLRPYIILWEAETNTYAVCPVTSKPHREHKVALSCQDFLEGNVLTYDPSFARPNIIYTLKQKETWKKTGTLRPQRMEEIFNKIKELADQPRLEEPKPKAIMKFRKKGPR